MFKAKVTFTLILVLALLFLAACSPSNMKANGTGGIQLTTAVRMQHSRYTGPREDVEYANEVCVTGGARVANARGDHPNYFESLTPAQKNRCVTIITSLCEEFDERSDDIEPIPEWRPVGPPVGYLKHFTSTVRGERNGESKVRNQFACAMYATMLEANAQIQRDRRQLFEIYQFRAGIGSENLSANVLTTRRFSSQEAKLSELIEKYRAGSNRPLLNLAVTLPVQRDRWKEMFERVDVIPIPVILMIAANESGYGRSEFGEDGWNLFGRHAFSRSCYNEGTCVTTRGGGVHLEKYYDLQHGINDQFNFLNGSGVSGSMRDIRLRSRGANQILKSVEFACGFDRYSATVGEYCRPYVDRQGRRQPSKFQAFIRDRGKWEKYDRILGSRDVIPAASEFIR